MGQGKSTRYVYVSLVLTFENADNILLGHHVLHLNRSTSDAFNTDGLNKNLTTFTGKYIFQIEV